MRVVYIDVDSLRPSHLGCYGYHRDTSPTIDALARRGTVFTGCHASDVPCLPSRSALFSGRFGIHNGVAGHAGTAARMRYPGDGHRTDPDRAPLPVALSAAGWRTVSFSSFPQRHLAWHFCAGWDEISRPGNTVGHETADEVAMLAIDWLRRNGRSEHFFLHVNLWDPHTPYRTPEEYGNPFADDEPPAWMTGERLAGLRGDFGPRGARDLVSRAREFALPRAPRAMETVADYKRWIDGYDVGIRYADDHVGRIVATLDDLGVLNETFVVVSADHGENQGELNVFGDHATADLATSLVPLVVSGPGVVVARHDELVYQLDLAPTLCDLVGVASPRGWDGMSFAPALSEVDGVVGRPYLVVTQGAWTCQRAVRTERFVFVRTYHAGLQAYPDVMLFDVLDDPHETRDLAESRPDVAAELDALLATWWGESLACGDAGPDPLVTVLEEGGPYYARLFREPYLRRLRNTGRAVIADEIEPRFESTPDPLSYAPRVMDW